MKRMVLLAMLVASLGLTSSVALAAAQANAGQGLVYGEVTQKFTTSGDGGTFLIAADGTPYEVPMMFWYEVQVGDTVKYTGTQWQIVETAFGPYPQRESDRVTSDSSPASSGALAGPTMSQQPYWIRWGLENMGN